MLDGQESELALRPAAESLAGEPARAHRDLRLSDLIARAEQVAVGIQERADARLLVVLQDEPAGPGDHGDDQEDRDPAAGRQAAEEQAHEKERKKRHGESHVGLEKDEERRQAHDRRELHERRGVKPAVLLVLEEVGDEQGRRDLGELRGLELELADPDPGAHIGDRLAEEEEVDERQEAGAPDRERELQEHPVVEEDRDGHRGEPDREPDRLAAREAVVPGSRRRRSDEEDPEGGQAQRASEHDDVEPAGPRKDAADHGVSARRAAGATPGAGRAPADCDGSGGGAGTIP